MYNLAKLLTEEPEKLERIGILFLKLMVTLLIGSAFFGFNISVSAFIHDPIPSNYSVTKLILFFISLVAIWFVTWSMIGELIIGELIISFLSWLVNRFIDKKDVFNDILSTLKVVKKKGKSIGPAKNVIIFNELLTTYYSEGEKVISESNSRARQYYIVMSIVYISLSFTQDVVLPCWLKVLAWAMILNFLLTTLVFKQIWDYFTENIGEIRKQFCRLSYEQMIIRTIEQNPFIKEHYEMKPPHAKIHLKRETDNPNLPVTFNIYPVFHWNNSLTKEMLDVGLQQRAKSQTSAKREDTHFDVIVCNVKPDDDNVKSILSQPGFVYMYCETEEEMSENLELLLFKTTNGFYRIH